MDYEVWCRGDRGADRVLVESGDLDEARRVFVEAAVRLAQGRWGRTVGRP